MNITRDSLNIAVVQAESIMFDKDKCIEKATGIIRECAENGAEFVVFPELFIPGYPYGMTFGFTVGSRNEDGRKDWKQYYDNSILADGPEMNKLIETAIANQVYVSIGYSEVDCTTATLYNSNMMITPDGKTFNHRKLKPTGSERVVWGVISLKRLLNHHFLRNWSSKMIKKSLEAYFLPKIQNCTFLKTFSKDGNILPRQSGYSVRSFSNRHKNPEKFKKVTLLPCKTASERWVK